MCSEETLHKFLSFHGFPGSDDELNMAVHWLNEMDIVFFVDLIGADLSKEAKPGEGCTQEVHEFIVKLATVIHGQHIFRTFPPNHSCCCI